MGRREGEEEMLVDRRENFESRKTKELGMT